MVIEQTIVDFSKHLDISEGFKKDDLMEFFNENKIESSLNLLMKNNMLFEEDGEFYFDEEVIEGKTYSRLQDRMKGMDVFSFGISTAPKSVKKLAERNGFEYLDYDFFVFHQANMKMNNMIAKKLKLTAEKVPSSMAHFGNTSSASIPITIATELKNQVAGHKKFICCGFGVGLSWGTVAFDTDNLVISDLVEVDEEKGESKWV